MGGWEQSPTFALDTYTTLAFLGAPSHPANASCFQADNIS